ncbi:MAG: hypothetical protein PHS41_09675 [Victivallaceae bacterium]|nr:hypothetical protein [Victivallaceae bacterium]
MYNRRCFDSILDLGQVPDVRFSEAELSTYQNWRDLVNAKMLRKIPADRTTDCPYCGNVIEFVTTSIRGCVTHLANCPDCGIFPLHNNDISNWIVDYESLVDGITRAMNGREPECLVSEILWNIGYAPLGRQSRQIFVVRPVELQEIRIQIEQFLPHGKTAILLVIGNYPDTFFPAFSDDRIFSLKQLCEFDGCEFSLNMDALDAQLHNMYLEKDDMPVAAKRNDSRDLLSGNLERTLESYILGMKSRLRSADDMDTIFRLPQFSLQMLAGMLPEAPSISTLSRTINGNPYLKILYKTVNDSEAIRSFSLSRFKH